MDSYFTSCCTLYVYYFCFLKRKVIWMVFRNNILFWIHCEKQHLSSTAGFFVPQSWVSVWYSFLVDQAITLTIYCRILSQYANHFCPVLFCLVSLVSTQAPVICDSVFTQRAPCALLVCLPRCRAARVQHGVHPDHRSLSFMSVEL